MTCDICEQEAGLGFLRCRNCQQQEERRRRLAAERDGPEPADAAESGPAPYRGVDLDELRRLDQAISARLAATDWSRIPARIKIEILAIVAG